jgi:hypothetical protein
MVRTGVLFRGELRDLSESGCYIATRARVQLEAGHMLELRLKLRNAEHQTLARVVQMIPGSGIRMEFLENGPRFLESVRRFCASQLLESGVAEGQVTDS